MNSMKVGGEPKRKKGYYRALKRKEPWALVRQGMREIGLKAFQDMLKPSPFLKLIGIKEQLDNE